MNVIYSFQVFDTIYVLTNGGPGSATEVLGTYAYKTAFGAARDQGYGAALGVVIFLLTLAFTILQWRNSRTRDEVASCPRSEVPCRFASSGAFIARPTERISRCYCTRGERRAPRAPAASNGE